LYFCIPQQFTQLFSKIFFQPIPHYIITQNQSSANVAAIQPLSPSPHNFTLYLGTTATIRYYRIRSNQSTPEKNRSNQQGATVTDDYLCATIPPTILRAPAPGKVKLFDRVGLFSGLLNIIIIIWNLSKITEKSKSV
jgi:hypothetical protein